MDLLDQVEASLTVQRVGIVEFCESDKFCDKRLYPRQKVLLKIIFLEELDGFEEDILNHWIAGGRNGSEIQISPNIRERVQYLRENGYNHFREITLVGGRRGAKGFITGLAMTKIMFDTLQLQDPGRHYGIDPDKEIYFSCVAASEDQAKKFQYADFVSAVEGCQAFGNNFIRSLETEFRVATSEDLRKLHNIKKGGGRIQRDIAKLRGNALAANAGTLRGSTTMGLVIDEMAHMIPGESKSSADQVYDAAIPSLDQFGIDGIIFLNSSPFSKVGKFYERNQEALKPFYLDRPLGEENQGNPLVMTFEMPSWALFEGYQDDPKKRFRKALACSPDWNPEEKNADGSPKWSMEDQRQIVVMRTEEASNPEKFKVERRGKFAEVIDAYLNPDMVDRVFQGLPIGFDEDARVILEPYHTNEGWNQATNLFRYKAHLDPSSTTAGFGFALAHTERFDDPRGFSQEHVVFDIIKRWNPADFPGGTIMWSYVIDETLEYIELFRPYEVTFDQFQSVEPVQTLQYLLQEKHIGDVRVYVKTATNEENWFRAETFKTAMNHGLVHGPVDSLGIDPYGPDEELKFLQKKNTGGKYPRVDKQDIGPVQTKDMADCMMECVQALIGNILAKQIYARAASAAIAPGALGGFRIGGHPRPPLQELHPNLDSYYGGRRQGEQNIPYNTIPHRGVIGGRGRWGMNRGRQRSRVRGR